MLFLLFSVFFLLSAASAKARVTEPRTPARTEEDRTPINTLRKNAASGDPDAQYQLARRYDRGAGMQKDPRMAAVWLLAAAEQGHATAQFYLGIKYENGEGVPANSTIALQWYAEANKGGIPRAKQAFDELYAKVNNRTNNEITTNE
ncbi:MAG: uncharacterized protein QG632_254 [Candidatus Dependentiae bacterium]|nr:uncharacterized protein [Candidatus Dependentiae bacterium]